MVRPALRRILRPRRTFLPSDIANCTGWFEADFGVFSDGGVIPCVEDATVQQWNSRPVNALGTAPSATQSTSNLRPTFKLNIKSGLPVVRFGGAHRMSGPSMGSSYDTAFTYFIVADKASASTGLSYTVQLTRFYTGRAAGETYYNTGLLSDTQMRGHAPGSANKDWLVESFTYDGATKRAEINGRAVYQEAATGNLGFTGISIFGATATGGTPYDGDIAAIVTYDRVLTAAEKRKVTEYLLVRYDILSKEAADLVRRPPMPLLAICGASNAQGYIPAIAHTDNWPRQLQNLLGGPGAVHLANHSLQARTAATWITSQAAQIDPSRTAHVYSKTCVVVQVGANDIDGGANAATTYGRIDDLCTALKTAGWGYVVVCTLTPTENAAFNLVRAAVNDSIQGDFSFADAMVDVETDATIGADAAASDTVVYSDGVHFTAEGARRFAVLVRVAVAGFFFNSQTAASISLSANSISEGASTGTAVGTLSVSNGSGSYTFTITADPSNKFAIDGSALEIDQTLDYETATSHSVTVQADNGVDPTFTQQFTVFVTDVDEGGGSTAGEAVGLLLALTKAA